MVVGARQLNAVVSRGVLAREGMPLSAKRVHY
jgi:hypothetical protein